MEYRTNFQHLKMKNVWNLHKKQNKDTEYSFCFSQKEELFLNNFMVYFKYYTKTFKMNLNI